MGRVFGSSGPSWAAELTFAVSSLALAVDAFVRESGVQVSDDVFVNLARARSLSDAWVKHCQSSACCGMEEGLSDDLYSSGTS